MIGYLANRPFKKIILVGTLATLPGLLTSFILLTYTSFDVLEKTTLITIVTVLTVSLIFWLYALIIRPWQRTSNMLKSILEEDFSQRALFGNVEDPIGLAGHELNTIVNALQQDRFKVRETEELLLKVLANVDMAVFLFDHKKRLVMANQTALSLYQTTLQSVVGKTAEQLDLNFAMDAAHTSSHEHVFPLKKSKWLVKHSAYHEDGCRHSIVMLADIQKNLRDEELVAWKRLIRVLSHEINNAMTPMKTTVGSLKKMVSQASLEETLSLDFSEGLSIIDRRVENLHRHVHSYTKIAQQPQPQKEAFSVTNMVMRIRQSFSNDDLVLHTSRDIIVLADEPQIEQVLVNLIKNALESVAPETTARLDIYWHLSQSHVCVRIEDNGTGLQNEDNLFTPYFTTKPDGNGIGLFVSRQIIEAHSGVLTLENKEHTHGCVATIKLPVTTKKKPLFTDATVV